MFVGAHMSIAWWLFEAFGRSEEIGGNTLQIFSKSPRGRSIPHYDESIFEQSVHQRKKHHQTGGIIHANYLANLSKPFEECKTDINSILHDFQVASKIGFEGVNVHIGKWKWFSTKEEAFKNMAKNVDHICKTAKKEGRDAQFLFENTAGQGSELGSNLEELGSFYKGYLKDLPVKFCIDTCHARAGWIDYTNFEQFLDQFDSKIGLDNLFCFHLNDSKAPLGAKLDRHASLGKGFIGLPVLKNVIQRAAKTKRHCYLETPEPEIWAEEIQMVNEIAAGTFKGIDAFHKKYFKSMALKKFEEKGLF